MKAKFESGALRGEIQSNGTVNGGAVSKSNGTYDYDKLKNHPVLNGEEIVGEKTSEDYNIVACKTSAEWAQLTTLVSMPGEVYVYSDGGGLDEEENPIPAIKVGDGETLVVDLPFISDPAVPEWAKQETKPTYTYDEVGAVGAENELHISEIDRMFAAVFGE